MKKLFIVSFAVLAIISGSCHNSTTPVAQPAPPASSGPDSAANNAILPPSGNPGSANNSSLADTSYHAKDSAKVKK